MVDGDTAQKQGKSRSYSRQAEKETEAKKTIYLLLCNRFLICLPQLLNHPRIVSQILLASNQDDRQACAEVHHLGDPLWGRSGGWQPDWAVGYSRVMARDKETGLSFANRREQMAPERSFTSVTAHKHDDTPKMTRGRQEKGAKGPSGSGVYGSPSCPRWQTKW